jgi:PadR family transcriptional regulator, regulatory protein PadR
VDQVGQLEQYVMLAILRRRPEAYAFAIREELKARIGREYTVSAIFAVLDKLERKGFVKAKKGEATPVRGGRAKSYYNLTAAGQRALSNSLKAIDNLRASRRSVSVAP